LGAQRDRGKRSNSGESKIQRCVEAGEVEKEQGYIGRARGNEKVRRYGQSQRETTNRE